jgi:hypothetical protein
MTTAAAATVMETAMATAMATEMETVTATITMPMPTTVHGQQQQGQHVRDVARHDCSGGDVGAGGGSTTSTVEEAAMV